MIDSSHTCVLVSSAGLHLLTCPYSVGRVWAGGRLVLDGLACVSGGHLAVRRKAGFSSLVFLPVVSHPLAGWARLVHVAAVLEEQQELKLRDPLRPRLRTGSSTTVTSTICYWSKQVTGQSRCEGCGNRLHLLMRGALVYHGLLCNLPHLDKWNAFPALR